MEEMSGKIRVPKKVFLPFQFTSSARAAGFVKQVTPVFWRSLPSFFKGWVSFIFYRHYTNGVKTGSRMGGGKENFCPQLVNYLSCKCLRLNLNSTMCN